MCVYCYATLGSFVGAVAMAKAGAFSMLRVTVGSYATRLFRPGR
ncbi:MAG TPA: hypothetical protein VGB42_07425 [Candidatus Thermoplasmatota archaeon]